MEIRNMEEKSIRLIYPPSLVNVPVIHQLIRRFDVTVNILAAEISPDRGWVDLKVAGSDKVIEAAVAWLNGQGIEVQPIGAGS